MFAGRLMDIEHSRSGYVADFLIYTGVVFLLGGMLVVAGSAATALQRVAEVAMGLVAWTLVEYGLHRFVLHGIKPFSRWHAEHHARPTALICTPTALSALLLVFLVWLPCWLLFGGWSSCALFLGVVTGYLGYALVHHAIHHWQLDWPWLQRRKRWHAMHHHDRRTGRYGVTSDGWDRVFGTARGRHRSGQ